MEKIPLRSEAQKCDCWSTNDIYAEDALFKAAVAKLSELGHRLAGYKGKLKTELLAALKLSDEISLLLADTYSYAALRADEDTGDAARQRDLGLISGVAVEVSALVSYMTPEILSIKDKLPKTPGLEVYKKHIADIIRQGEHILPEREERIMALSGETAGSAGDVFSMLVDADMHFGLVRDENGREVELTHGRFVRFMESKDRRVRKDAFDATYKVYGEHRHTLAALQNAHDHKNKFYKLARGYKSCLEMCIDDNNIPPAVYHGLIKAAGGGFPDFYKYMELRRRALQLSELHCYDLYVPFVENPYGDISYSKAKELVLAALAPLGEEYLAVIRRAFNEGWIDIYENKGKRAGAYSNGNPQCHPFILLNYQGNLDSVFTLAHELGHAMHSYLSNKTQPACYREYGIFVAEVASTVNEALLQHYLMGIATKEQRLYLQNHALEQFRATFFRQTMFAEFELATHEEVEGGAVLTAEGLCETYKGLLKKYFGPEVVLDPGIEFEWSRIPHFYYDFYVYQYATGFAAAQTLAGRIVKGEGVENYLKFLSLGSSLDPLDALRVAGVDLESPQPVGEALRIFGETVAGMSKSLFGE
ncbi:MAG TPA: oligoendopeptidase F [Candidatus Acidoferrum sp.]|nr:oligoendopeptidase F [Candidatus Acidoferrum sp.]